MKVEINRRANPTVQRDVIRIGNVRIGRVARRANVVLTG
jgi:hypothetical protein